MSGPLWTRDEIAAATRGWITDEIGPVAGISIDTRTLKAGDLFFAIKGDARDGHDFVRDALAKGAAAAVVAEARAPDFVDSGTLIVVPDVLGAMRDLAARARAPDERAGRRRHGLGRQDRAPRRRCASSCRARAPRTPRSPPTTITGACP